MDNNTAVLGALRRCRARRPIREARGLALAALLQGEDIAPDAIDDAGRQKTRARLLGREDLAVGEGLPTSRRLFEAVIGTDDTLPRRFLTLGDEAGRAIGRITVRLADGSGKYGTGSLISQHLMITNNHVLQSPAEAGQAILELGYHETAPDTFPPMRQVFRVQPEKFFYTSEDLDFTIVGVENDNGEAATANYGSLELLAESGKAVVGEKVNIIQHAGGMPQTVSIRENTLVDVFDQWLHYAADTAPGSSGAPVFNDEWQVVGIHHASVPNGAIADGGVVNEGVRISAILQHLTEALS